MKKLFIVIVLVMGINLQPVAIYQAIAQPNLGEWVSITTGVLTLIQKWFCPSNPQRCKPNVDGNLVCMSGACISFRHACKDDNDCVAASGNLVNYGVSPGTYEDGFWIECSGPGCCYLTDGNVCIPIDEF
jgi:hypothetical protein